MLIGAIQKSIKESWRSSFTSKLVTSEKKHASKIASYLKGEYAKGVDRYIERGAVGATDDLFKNTDLKNFYIDIYESIGVEFAVWYERNLDKFLSKSAGNRSTWAEKFAEVGATQAGAKVVIVQGTALTQLVGTIDKLFRDEEFQGLGRAQQGRILKSRFNQISTYQAERIVRTEATNAANQGIMASARDIFGENSLEKEWIASGDSRTRSFSRGDKAEHLAMDGTRVDYKERFSVPYSGGIDLMLHPGDPSAHAVNVINCRCSTAVLPKEGAQVREGVELTGFGGGLAARGTSLVGDQLVAAPKPAPVPAPEVEELIDATFTAKNIEEAKERALSIMKSSGIKSRAGSISSEMPLDRFNNYNKEIKRLTDKYDITGEKNIPINSDPFVDISFESNKKYYGSVTRYTRGNKKLVKINFGHQSDTGKSRLSRKKFDGKMYYFGKSQVDEVNLEIATVTHEFAHVISKNVSRAADEKELLFWKEIRSAKRKYDKERKEYISNQDDYNYNQIYLGSYADTNMDEFYAEAFTEYELNSNPSKYAKMVGEIVEKYFKK